MPPLSDQAIVFKRIQILFLTLQNVYRITLFVFFGSGTQQMEPKVNNSIGDWAYNFFIDGHLDF